MSVDTRTATVRRSWALDLDGSTLYALLRLRVDVFVVEQRAAYPELDGRDLEERTRHYWLADREGTGAGHAAPAQGAGRRLPDRARVHPAPTPAAAGSERS